MPTSVQTINLRVESLGLPAVAGEEDTVARLTALPLSEATFALASACARHLGGTEEFNRVIDYFKVPAGHLPAGFRVEWELAGDGVLRADLVRDIAWDTDGRLRPTPVLLSADTANPYELEPIAPLIANLTCNPGIIYDLFINNPKANLDHRFSTRDEVMAEIGRILGSGCDISVELNNPFDPDFAKILDEAQKFSDMLGRWRAVIKVPHTGPVNSANVGQLLDGSKLLDRRWFAPATADSLAGHRLALKLREHGFRVNFTLMFEPHQALLALQARPAYINSFVRHRLLQSTNLAALLAEYRESGDEDVLVRLRDYLIKTDYLSSADSGFGLRDALQMAEETLALRRFDGEGDDGLDDVRHNLRVLRTANLPQTRLIICSMEGATMYPSVERLLAEPEFADMGDRVVITAEPAYLARFASANQVVSYQRRFMTAARGQS